MLLVLLVRVSSATQCVFFGCSHTHQVELIRDALEQVGYIPIPASIAVQRSNDPKEKPCPYCLSPVGPAQRERRRPFTCTFSPYFVLRQMVSKCLEGKILHYVLTFSAFVIPE